MQINGTPYVVDLTRAEALPGEKDASRKVPAERNSGQRGFDRVDISADSRSLDGLKRQLAVLPDVRPDRVALARQTLQDGGYPVPPALVAAKIMEAYGA